MTHPTPLHLIEDKVLDQRAQVRAEYLCAHNQWSHKGFEDSFKGLEYINAAEVLARGFTDPTTEFNAFMASPTHRKVLTSLMYRKIGYGRSCGIDVLLFTY